MELGTSKGPQAKGDINNKELLRKQNEYKEKCNNHDEDIFNRNMNIVTTLLEHLNKRLNNRLNSIHYSYSSMVATIRNFDIDRERVIPLMEIWIPQKKELVLISIVVKKNSNPPKNFKATMVLVLKCVGQL